MSKYGNLIANPNATANSFGADLNHVSNLEALLRQYHKLITKGMERVDAQRWIKNNWSGSGYLDNDDLRAIDRYYQERFNNRYNEHYPRPNSITPAAVVNPDLYKLQHRINEYINDKDLDLNLYAYIEYAAGGKALRVKIQDTAHRQIKQIPVSTFADAKHYIDNFGGTNIRKKYDFGYTKENPVHYSIYEKATNKTYLQVKRGGREAAEKIASDLNNKAGYEKYAVMGFGNENPKLINDFAVGENAGFRAESSLRSNEVLNPANLTKYEAQQILIKRKIKQGTPIRRRDVEDYSHTVAIFSNLDQYGRVWANDAKYGGARMFAQSVNDIRKATAAEVKRYTASKNPAKSKDINLPNTNLYLQGFGHDANGNAIIKLTFPNSRGFSIQINDGLTEIANLYTKNISKLSSADITAIRDKVVWYIRNYGSKTQRSKMYLANNWQMSNPIKQNGFTKKDLDSLLRDISHGYYRSKQEKQRAIDFLDNLEGEYKGDYIDGKMSAGTFHSKQAQIMELQDQIKRHDND